MGLQDLLQELNEAGAVPPWAAQRRGQSCRGLEGAQHTDTPLESVGGSKGSPTHVTLQYRLWRNSLHAWIGTASDSRAHLCVEF